MNLQKSCRFFLYALIGLMPLLEVRAQGPAPAAPVVVPPKDVLVPSALESSPSGWMDLFAAAPLATWARAPLPPTKPLNERNPWRYDASTGVLTCEGAGIHEMLLFPQPQRDGIFHVEWRYVGVLPKPNSGIFVRTQADNSVWYQAQLAPGSSGILFGTAPTIQGKPQKLMAGVKRPDLIRPPGEWNTMEVSMRGRHATLWYNGVLVVETDQVTALEGLLGFEAEGAPIEFRRVLFKALPAEKAATSSETWRDLFNGRDYAGWVSFLAKPHETSEVAGEARDAQGKYLKPIGLDRDPANVFTVVHVDGRPAMRISGEVFGTISTREEFSNYHLRMQFKWGDKKWPPRDKVVRDSGLLYHIYTEIGAGGATWPSCLEYQIQEKDCGDLFPLRSEAMVNARLREGEKWAIYDPAGAPLAFSRATPQGGRCVHAGDFEKPAGEWNTLEVICVGNESVHLVNGHVVLRVRSALAEDGSRKPVNAGGIGMQSEGAEIFFRDIAVRPVNAIPAGYAPVTKS